MSDEKIDIEKFLSSVLTTIEQNANANVNEKMKDILSSAKASISNHQDQFLGVNDQYFRSEFGKCYEIFLHEIQIFNDDNLSAVDKMKVGNIILGSLSNLKLPNWLRVLIDIIKEIVAIALLFDSPSKPSSKNFLN